MKKLINLVALVMLVSVNVLTPFSYADMENMIENIEMDSENEITISDDESEEAGGLENLSVVDNDQNSFNLYEIPSTPSPNRGEP
jgi:hypothetical protein